MNSSRSLPTPRDNSSSAPCHDPSLPLSAGPSVVSVDEASASPCDGGGGSCGSEAVDMLFSLSGADAIGVARAGEVEPWAMDCYGQWIAEGNHAAMTYMENYPDVRRDPRLLLPGARSIIMLAYSYYTPDRQPASAPAIALYARGSDYHNVLRRRLSSALKAHKMRFGGDYRICVDSAPLRERYWAVKAGLGFIGRNSQLIVPGVGSYCFLAAVVTTLELPESQPCERQECDGCGRCEAACPGQAIIPGRCAIDARRCVSYLTVEAGRTDDSMRGWPAGVKRGNRLLGCDVCQVVCPHNKAPRRASLPQFEPREAVMNLTVEGLLAMDQESFDREFAGSPVRRAPLAYLKSLLDI